jgi:transketolase
MTPQTAAPQTTTPRTGDEAVRQDRHDCRDAFAGTLVELAEADPRIVAVVNDSVGSSKLGDFRSRFP